jgi:hypothetical protein
MDSKAEGLRQSMLEKQRQKIYEESEKERQKNAKVFKKKKKRVTNFLNMSLMSCESIDERSTRWI